MQLTLYGGSQNQQGQKRAISKKPRREESKVQQNGRVIGTNDISTSSAGVDGSVAVGGGSDAGGAFLRGAIDGLQKDLKPKFFILLGHLREAGLIHDEPLILSEQGPHLICAARSKESQRVGIWIVIWVVINISTLNTNLKWLKY